MSHITLIRHGQANTGARDEKSYDRLSDLGHQQAAWLGSHLKDNGDYHSRVYCGTLRRHIETASSMELPFEPVQDKRLNEMEYFELASRLEEQEGTPIPQEREGFIEHLPMVYQKWRDGEISNPPETFQDFEHRVSSALADIAEGEGPALVVTSGGTIAMALRHSLGLNTKAMAQMTLAIMNSSMHRLFPIGGQLSPVLFNAVPHLSAPDRHFAQTHL